MPDAIFVPGKPITDIWGAPGLRWRDALAQRLTTPLHRPRLAFTRSDRSWYDLDNLVYPVLAVTGIEHVESVWATVARGTPEGVRVWQAAPPSPPDEDNIRLYIARPSASSVRERAAVPELEHVEPFGDDAPLGLALQFDALDAFVGNMSYDGPTKSCIDDLRPLFGETTSAGRVQPKDYRVRELRITRGHAPGASGVTVTLWRLARAATEDVTPVPDASPAPPAERGGDEMWTTFLDDDDGFLRWRDTHPLGFVVNHEREPKPHYLKVHRATCWTISGLLPARGDNWTTALAKTCAVDLQELRRWARTVGGELDRCRTCDPA